MRGTADSLQGAGEHVADTPVLLNTELARVLPVVVLVGELSGNVTNGVADGVHGSLLLGRTRNSLAVAVTSIGPARLANKDLVIVADALEKLNLAGNKVTSILSSNVAVEEGLEVGRGKVNNTTKSGTRGLPDVKRLSDSELTAVTGTLDGSLGRRNEASEVRSRAVSVRESLVVKGDELNTSPAVGLTPVDNVANLAGARADTAGVNVDTEDDLKTETNGLASNSLQLVAVGGVHADSVETVGLDVLKLGQDVVSAHAGTSVVGVASVGNGVVGMLTQSAASGAGRGAGRSGSRGRGGSNWRRSDRAGRDRSGGSSGCGSDWGRSRSGRRGEGAHVGVGSLHNGHGLLRLGVGTRSHSGGSRVDNDSAGGNSGGDGSNGVSTGRGADVGGGLNDAGESAADGADGSVGADHGGGGLDDSGHTTNGVSTTGEDGGSCLRNNGGGRNSDGGSWDSVGARRGEDSHYVGWERHNRSRGRRLDSHGAVAGGQQSGGAGRGGGGSWGRDGRNRDDCFVSTLRSVSIV